MLQGFGAPIAKTNLLGDLTAAAQRIAALELTEMSFAAETEQKIARAFNFAGRLVTASSAQGATENTLTLTFEQVNWPQIGFALGYFPKTQASYKYGSAKVAEVVNNGGTYEVVDTGITASDNDFIFAYVDAPGAWGEAGYLIRGNATPGAGEFYIDTANNRLTFDSSYEGANVVYQIPTELTTVEYYGGPGVSTQWGEFTYLAIIYTPAHPEGLVFEAAKCTRSSSPTFTINDGVPTVSVDIAMATPSGWEEPWRLTNVKTGQ